MEPRAAKRTYDAQLDLHRTRMTQRRASTPDILVYHSSPSRHRVGNRLPPRGELSPAGKQEGETIERRKKIVAKKVTSSFNVKFADAGYAWIPGRRRGWVSHPSEWGVRETIGCEGRGNAINRRDWGSRSQTLIGSHTRAVEIQSRNVVHDIIFMILKCMCCYT